MNAENLGAISGIVLSLLFSYVPGLNAWFAALEKQRKQLIMGLLLVAVALGAFALSCAGVNGSFICTKDGAIQAGQVLIAALVANQSIYLITRK